MSCDLHIHSKISDGSLGIDEIIATARRRGLTTIAITDHDAVAGATRAGVIGKRQGVDVIHGVEFSAWDAQRGKKVHILGYLCDTPDRLEGLCRQVNAARRAAATEMVKKVLRYYPIVPESVVRCASGSTNVYKQHIMHALIDAGYADSFYGDVYKKLFDTREGCAYVPIEYPETRQVIDLIHSAGGLAVLAHPHTYHSEELMEELTADASLDGIEVWHHSNDPQQTEQLAAFAAEHGLLATGGSDFHGMYSSTLRSLGSYGAPDDIVQTMLAYKAKKNKK